MIGPVGTLADLRREALRVALAQEGVREVGGPNMGPEVEEFLAAVRLQPGQPWCAAFIVWCYDQAAAKVGLRMPLRRTGKVSRLWNLTSSLYKTHEPIPGAVYCHLEDPTDDDSPGHCGIVIRLREGWFDGIEGNTNAAGSRIGDRVRINQRRLEYVNAGYLDVGKGEETGPAMRSALQS